MMLRMNKQITATPLLKLMISTQSQTVPMILVTEMETEQVKVHRVTITVEPAYKDVLREGKLLTVIEALY
jgi:hypothetical protein